MDRTQQADDYLDKSALAASVRPQQCDDLPRVDMEVNVLKNQFTGVSE
ncbi:hypothetical protein [Desulfobacterium sp. N47]